MSTHPSVEGKGYLTKELEEAVSELREATSQPLPENFTLRDTLLRDQQLAVLGVLECSLARINEEYLG